MIVCEVGLNHVGNVAYSFDYIARLTSCACDAITYQIREDEFYLNDSFVNTKLPLDHYKEIKKISNKSNKKFGIALANYTKIDMCENIDVDFYKVLSWDLDNYDFINNLLQTDKLVYISTGMSEINDIIRFFTFFEDSKHFSNIRLIHTQLSNEIKHVNFKVIPYLQKKCGVPVGYGHHCDSENVLHASPICEPSDIFFYVRGEQDIKHPDQSHALSLNDVTSTIRILKDVGISVGTETKIKMKNNIDKENLNL